MICSVSATSVAFGQPGANPGTLLLWLQAEQDKGGSKHTLKEHLHTCLMSYRRLLVSRSLVTHGRKGDYLCYVISVQASRLLSSALLLLLCPQVYWGHGMFFFFFSIILKPWTEFLSADIRHVWLFGTKPHDIALGQHFCWDGLLTSPPPPPSLKENVRENTDKRSTSP